MYIKINNSYLVVSGNVTESGYRPHAFTSAGDFFGKRFPAAVSPPSSHHKQDAASLDAMKPWMSARLFISFRDTLRLCLIKQRVAFAIDLVIVWRLIFEFFVNQLNFSGLGFAKIPVLL